jgi:hypothetical protein
MASLIYLPYDIPEVPNPYSELFYKYYDLSLPFWDETAAALMVDPSISVNQTSGMSYGR